MIEEDFQIGDLVTLSEEFLESFEGKTKELFVFVVTYCSKEKQDLVHVEHISGYCDNKLLAKELVFNRKFLTKI